MPKKDTELHLSLHIPRGVLPIMAYKRRTLPKEVPFSGFERIGISLAEVNERKGKFIIWSVKGRKKSKQKDFMAVKKARKHPDFVIYLTINE